jgi:DNA-binding transcriptional regulator YbjK
MVKMEKRDADRKELLADAAIAVIGADGLRALTHRAVDARAGLPQGTCSYHYPSRRALLGAALERIAVLDRAEADRESDPTALLTHWLSAARTRTRARLVLMLDPEARAELGDLADRLTQGFVDDVAALTGDRYRARLLVALFDGLAADELIRGDCPPAERRERVRAVLGAIA